MFSGSLTSLSQNVCVCVCVCVYVRVSGYVCVHVTVGGCVCRCSYPRFVVYISLRSPVVCRLCTVGKTGLQAHSLANFPVSSCS